MSSEFNSSGNPPTSTPDWTKPFGVTTPRDRVGASHTRQDSNYASTWDTPGFPFKIETEDRGKRTESGDETIWQAYEEGF